jgi:hypothetical protein
VLRDDVVGTGYVVKSFQIRKVDVAASLDTAARLAREFKTSPEEFDQTGWHPAYVSADSRGSEFGFLFDSTRGHLLDWGVVVGLYQSALISRISEALEAIKTEDLYSAPIDETKRVIETRSPLMPPLTVSDRQDADERVAVAITVVFEDFLWPLLNVAVATAWQAASIVGRDVAAAPERHGRRRGALPVKQASAAEREGLSRSAADAVRKLLRDALSDPDVVRRAGRQVESERDHRAYCMRERIVHSEDLAHLPLINRQREAKRRVKNDLPLSCSDSSWARIMASGRAIHARVAPNIPFCADP